MIIVVDISLRSLSLNTVTKILEDFPHPQSKGLDPVLKPLGIFWFLVQKGATTNLLLM